MKTIEVEVYEYHELNESAKSKARDWYIENFSYFWFDESINSLKAFCDCFNIQIKDYEISPYTYSYIKTDCDNSKFRGLTLDDIDEMQLSDGFYIGEIVSEAFCDYFKESGSALKAFQFALDKGLKSLLSDWEAQYEEESIKDFMSSNEYTFTEQGNRFYI